MIINRFILSAIALLVSHLTVGVTSYLGARNYYLLQIEQIRTDAQIELAKAIADKNEKENVYSKTLSSAQSVLGIQTEKITGDFVRLVSVGLPDNLNGGDSVSLSDSKDNAGGNAGVSDPTQTARAVSECKCECPADYRAKLQRLYREQLNVARDCDITSSKYNSLLEFYQSITK